LWDLYEIFLVAFFPEFKKALSLHRIANIVTLPRFSKLIVQHDGHLLSFHLGLLARFVQGSGADSNLFGSSVERLAKDTNVSFFTAGVMNARTLGMSLIPTFIIHSKLISS
jgi:hypothetical protein